MRLIALTGGIGTGKSTVSRLLAERGARIVDADLAARAVVEPGTEGLARLVAEFGPGILQADGTLDRPRLAALAFSDPERRARLNAITHPLVGRWMAERTAEAAAEGAPVVVHDIPLLYENDRQGAFEKVIVVYAPDAVALERLRARGMADDDARARIAAQLPIDEKRRRADVVIDNSGDPAATRAQVERVWTEITAETGTGP